MIKLNKHNVTNGTIKARVWYSMNQNLAGARVAQIMPKSFDDGALLALIFPENYRNATDAQQDCYHMGAVKFTSGHPLFEAIKSRAA